jgi:signal peptidase
MILPCKELIPLIQYALDRGQNVRMTVRGKSMVPFVFDNDIVELEPIHRVLSIGDVVLAESSKEHYTLHRIVHLKGDRVWIRGDAQTFIEGPIPYKNVIGRAVSINHNKKIYYSNRSWLKLLGLIWLKFGFVRLLYFQIVLPFCHFIFRINRFIRKVLK